MPWWKPSSSSANSPSSPSPSPSPSPSSPLRHRSLWGRRDDGRRLTRQRKLRHLSDGEVGGVSLDSPTGVGVSCSAGSTPVSRSPSNLDFAPFRSSSFPVLLPQPLPLPDHSSPLPHRESGLSLSPPTSGGGGGCPLPSPRGHLSRAEADEGSSSAVEPWEDRVPSECAAAGCALPHQTARKFHELVDAPSNGSTVSCRRKSLQDANYGDTVNFRLNIPARSAPTSGYSSPVRSPRRLSNVDMFPSTYNAPQGFQVRSMPEIPSEDVSFSPRTSPEKILGSPERSPRCSPSMRSPIFRSRNPSAPPSPLHPKMFPEGSAAWHDGSGNINVHPLPLPPGATIPLQSVFTHQSPAKTEVSQMTNQWQKGRLIGSGTFGHVYVATNKHTGALCAMKEVNLIPDDPKSAECLKQLEQEINLLSQLKHQNIVQYYGSGMIDDRFYIYLEYVYPGSINKYVREHCGAMTESVVRNFTRHILEGLAYLHSTNTIHRDIKGANLLVDAHGVVKLADFGMAKHLSGAAGALSLKGTPHWMAPEVLQATMNKDIGYDLAVDIWSLGCTIIEMFTGKHPWSGLEGAAAMFKVLHNDPQIPETLSPDGKDFLRLCFRRNPVERPPASKLLKHPFIRNSHHYNLHGSIQAFTGIKLLDNKHSPRERQSKSDSAIKGKQLSNGEACHCHPGTSESAASHISPRSTLEVTPSLFPHASHVAPSLAGLATNFPIGVHSVNGVHSNGVHSAPGNHYPYVLSKPHG